MMSEGLRLRAINPHAAPSMGTSPAACFAAPREASGHATTGNERRIVAGISSFAFQVAKRVMAALKCSLSADAPYLFWQGTCVKTMKKGLGVGKP